MLRAAKVYEVDLATPVLTLFPVESYVRLEQVPLGRKRIDLVLFHRKGKTTTSVELKIADWKKALWQAIINKQVSNESFIAIWHECAHRALKHRDLIHNYGIGMMVVYRDSAHIAIAPGIRHIDAAMKSEWYRKLLGQQAATGDSLCNNT